MNKTTRQKTNLASFWYMQQLSLYMPGCRMQRVTTNIRRRKKLHTENYSNKLLLISIFFFSILQLKMTNVAVESADSI